MITGIEIAAKANKNKGLANNIFFSYTLINHTTKIVEMNEVEKH